MSGRRPDLNDTLSPSEFRAWYWLKEELAAFCRSRKLPTGGSKRELAARIESHLSGEPVPGVKKRTRRAGAMPDRFELETMIGEGWHCSQPLRAFFEGQCGKGFRFNAALRDFIAIGAGKTLADAVKVYRQSKALPRGNTEIGDQFEYNRHFREYYSTHPEATREEAIAAWKRKRSERKE